MATDPIEEFNEHVDDVGVVRIVRLEPDHGWGTHWVDYRVSVTDPAKDQKYHVVAFSDGFYKVPITEVERKESLKEEKRELYDKIEDHIISKNYYQLLSLHINKGGTASSAYDEVQKYLMESNTIGTFRKKYRGHNCDEHWVKQNATHNQISEFLNAIGQPDDDLKTHLSDYDSIEQELNKALTKIGAVIHKKTIF